MAFDFDKIIQNNQFDKKNPPIHLWKPTKIIPFDISIDINGLWYHEGNEIKKEKISNLFSRLLRFENGQYFLITPNEAYQIKVKDVPFIIVSLVEDKNDAYFVTNQQDVIPINAKMEIELRLFDKLQLPYIRVRDKLFARVSRSCYYDLVNRAIDQGNDNTVVIQGQSILIG